MSIQKILLNYEPERKNLLLVAGDLVKHFGHLSQEMVDQLAKYFEITPAEVFSALSFYDRINFSPVANIEIKICDSAHCMMKKSDELIQWAEDFFHQKADLDSNVRVKIERISCRGLCAHGPIMIVNGILFEKVNLSRAREIISSYLG